MKKFILIILCLMSFTALGTTHSFATDFNALITNTNEDINIGILIFDPQKNKVLFTKNAKKNFAPASTLKIFTALSGLSILGNDYRYTTSISANTQKLTSNTLQDNIYLKFSGDPSLTIEQIDQLLQQLTANGIKKITGSFYIDDTAQDLHPWSEGTVLEDTKFCFAAPVGAIIINQNCIEAEAVISNEKKILINSNELPYIKIINQLQYSPTNSKTELEVKDNNNYLLTGYIQSNTPLKIAVKNNRLFCKNIIEQLLRKNSIQIQNGIKFGATPSNLSIVAHHESIPLIDLMAIMLKHSNNIIANAVYRTLGESKKNASDTWMGGSQTVKNFLHTNLHIASNKLSIADGSGESIYNLIKPNQLLQALNYIYSKNFEVFKNLLPQSGVDGTLKNRMQSPVIHVYAKTGTETGVSSLAGFIETKKHKTLCFVIMINNGLQDSEHYRNLEDKICYLINKHF